MNLRIIFILAFLWPIQLFARMQESKPPLALSIHYSDGLSAKSSTSALPEIILFMEHTHLHLIISNISDHDVTLWRPFCPAGDEAITFEFKESELSKEIMKAHIRMGYTAGMAYEKTLTLAPNDSLVFNVDFLGYWDFPFEVKSREMKKIFIRAVYNPKPAPKSDLKMPPQANDVWFGRVETGWENVVIINRTDKNLFEKAP
jgi:hypothetical protein